MPATKPRSWHHDADTPVATIRQLMGRHYPKWMWAHCLGGAARDHCDHTRPLALAQFGAVVI